MSIQYIDIKVTQDTYMEYFSRWIFLLLKRTFEQFICSEEVRYSKFRRWTYNKNIKNNFKNKLFFEKDKSQTLSDVKNNCLFDINVVRIIFDFLPICTENFKIKFM